jgi:hypothetical protein
MPRTSYLQVHNQCDNHMITMGPHAASRLTPHVWLASERTDNPMYAQRCRKNHVEELKVLRKRELIFAFEMVEIPEDFYSSSIEVSESVPLLMLSTTGTGIRYNTRRY